MTFIICTESEALELKLKLFQTSIEPKGLKPNGEQTQGGISNAPIRFKKSCEDAFNNLDLETATIPEICERAVKLADEIVTFHVFYNGNGRTSMYAIYLFMACCGYKLYVTPIALHPYMFGEDQKGSLPKHLNLKVAEFLTTELTEKELRSHLTHTEIRLKALEDARASARKYDSIAEAERPTLKTNPSAVYVDSGIHSLEHFKKLKEKETSNQEKRLREREKFDQTNSLFSKIKKEWISDEEIPFYEISSYIKKHYKEHGRVPSYEEYKESQW